MKTIIVACGGGVATSKTVANKVENMLKEDGLDGMTRIYAININELSTYIKNADLYVAITQENPDDYNVPVFSGIPFLTGIGLQEEFDKIKKILLQ